MSGSAMLGIGSVSMWGLTPSMDLHQFIDGGNKKVAPNILLIGQCDARHVLNTLANRPTYQSPSITENTAETESNPDGHLNFYIIESSMELYARQMLLLALACQTNKVIGAHEKCIQFMELYGNILVRYQTKKTLKMLTEQLIKMTTDEDYLEVKFPLVKLRTMKFLERDKLVDILKYWLEFSESKKTNMENIWDVRLRNYLGTRYDSRLNIFDWDYNMKLVEKDEKASIISCQEYKEWRNTGVAFTEFESLYSQPNVTLNSAINKKNVFTYCGDTITGPFVSYGIRSSDNSVFEKMNDRYKNKSFNVTYKNLQNIFEKLRPSVTDSTKNSALTDSTVHFLPVNAGSSLYKNSKFLHLFDLIYISASSAQSLTPELVRTLKPKAKIIIEKTRYSLEFREEHEKLFQDKVLELANKSGLHSVEFLNEDLESNYFQFSIEVRESDRECVSSGVHNDKQDGMSDSDSSEVTSDWETLSDNFNSKTKVEDRGSGDLGDGDHLIESIQKSD